MAATDLSWSGPGRGEVIVVEGCGDGYSEAKRMMKKPDEKEKLQAAREMAKILGISSQKIDLGGNLGVTIIDDLGE